MQTICLILPNFSDLSTSPVDLVILAIDDDQSIFLRKQSWYDSVTLWCSRSIAPVLCLCPPEEKVWLRKCYVFLNKNKHTGLFFTAASPFVTFCQ